MDISVQARTLIDQANQFEEQRANYMLQNSYYDYLKEYLQNKDGAGNLISPSTMGISDPL